MTPLQMVPPRLARPAPAWNVASWLNTTQSPTLSSLRGRVVLMHAFQMLCPGCVAHGIPQAQRAHELFSANDVFVLGLHTVFEHHEAMGRTSLAAFLHEYRVAFPVGIDEPGIGTPIPRTMATYEMRGTPTLILIDRAGRLRLHAFGRPDDMSLGAVINALVTEGVADSNADAREAPAGHPSCDDVGCTVP